MLPGFSRSWPSAWWSERGGGEVETEKQQQKITLITFEFKDLEPISHVEKVKGQAAYCPSCRNRYGRKTLDEVVTIEGPLYSKRDVGEGRLRPLVKISSGYQCTACGYSSTKKSILLPLETYEIIRYILKPEIADKLTEMRERGDVLEKLLNTILA